MRFENMSEAEQKGAETFTFDAVGLGGGGLNRATSTCVPKNPMEVLHTTQQTITFANLGCSTKVSNLREFQVSKEDFPVNATTDPNPHTSRSFATDGRCALDQLCFEASSLEATSFAMAPRRETSRHCACRSRSDATRFPSS
jgi:hypothetical protein